MNPCFRKQRRVPSPGCSPIRLPSFSVSDFLAIAASVAFVAGPGGSSPLHAATHDDFDDNGVPDTPSTLMPLGVAPGPSILPGGIDGNYLNLITTVGNQNNGIAYDLSDPGAWSVIEASFDFRGDNDVNAADGFCFLLVPTSIWGASFEGIPLGTAGIAVAEEPSIAGTAAVAFDLWQAINEVSGHWDLHTQVSNNVPIDLGVDLNSGSWHRADLRFEQIGNATNVVVNITPDVEGGGGGFPVEFLRTVLPDMLPYESRVQFHGRTGGASMNVDLDNIDVQYSVPFDIGALPVVTPDGLFQDFDSVGGTSYVARLHAASDISFIRPGPRLLPADPGSDGVFLRLVDDGINGHNNTIAFDRAADGGVRFTGQSLGFDFRILNEDGADPADGFGVYLLSTAAYGLRGGGAGGVAFEQTGLANALHVGFDVYPAGTNDAVLTIGAVELGRFPIDPGVLNLAAGVFHRADLEIVPGSGGLVVSLRLVGDVNGVPTAPVPVFENIDVPGVPSSDYRVQFGARTGGLNLTVDLDNIETTSDPAPFTSFLNQNFQGEGTGFVTSAIGTGTAPALTTVDDSIVLRLLQDGVNDSVNAIAFDQAETGELGGDQLVIADFDFRIETAAVMQGADGFSLRFLPTDTYGTTGPGAGFMGNAATAEEPNLPGILAVGFDLHPGDIQNDVSVHWDGIELVNVTIDPAVIDLDDGAWHHARVIWRPAVGGSEISVIIDETETIADALAIAGLDLYPYRAEFAGRTGGLNMTLDLDNIVIADQDRLNEDSDGDLLPNLWEVENGLDPFSAVGDDGADGDPDMDGSPNSEELARGTNPQDPDHDDDGIRDGAETNDGNFVSVDATGTDPRNADSDGDGLLDGVENPLLPWDPDNAANQPGSDPNIADTDGDGFLDGAEVNAGTDPTSAASRPEAPAGTILMEDFDIFMINSVYALNSTSGTPASIVDSGSHHGQVLQLTSLTASNLNSVAWDYVPIGRDTVELSFEFRMSADPVGGNAADGFGIGLFDIAVYGETGPVDPLTGGAVYEDPRTGSGFPSALYVGFDIYPGDPDGNNIRVTGLGGSTELIADVPGPFLLNDDRFHAARIILRGNGAGGSTLTLILIEDIDGVSGDPIEHELITEASVAGLDPATFEGRLIAGGRTGGAFTLTWLDRLRLGAVAGSGGDFAITSIDLDRELGEVSLTWNSEPGAFYIIESSTNLVDWLEVDDSIPSGGSTTTRSGIPVDSDTPNTTYRIRRQ